MLYIAAGICYISRVYVSVALTVEGHSNSVEQHMRIVWMDQCKVLAVHMGASDLSAWSGKL